MDVAVGATDVPLPREIIQRTLQIAFGFLILASLAQDTLALGVDEPVQTSGDKSYWDRRKRRVELVGHAIVREQGETLFADRIVVDFDQRSLDAKGSCIYVTADSIVYGEEMHLNLDTRTGVVTGARVSNDRFSLTGERINKLSQNRFQAHWGEYSTCQDCPNSWSLEAEDLDLTFEQYAYMSNVTAKVKDAPAFWLPYLIVPVKSVRQTGLLFPKFGLSTNNGFMFVQPFFWATSRSTDMTIALGEYGARGRRDEWEGRYVLSPRSSGTANFFNVNDKTFDSVKRERWGLDVAQSQELPFGVDEKFKFTEVSDTLYPIDFSNDTNPNGNEFLASDLILSYGTSEVSAWIDAKRLRNLINLNPDPVRRYTDFDSTTVQLLPSSGVTTHDRFILGTNIAGGLTMGVSNFSRGAGPFDYDSGHLSQLAPGGAPNFIPGIDPIREATRISYTPSLYTTLRPFDVINLVPSARYFGYYYSFHNSVSNLNRGYLLLQADMSAQLERIYDTPDPDRPKQKHLIRPMLTYSNIPFIQEDRNHPFLEQIQYAATQGFSGYNFDDYDIVPVDQSPSNQNYFVPLGNSISYGFSTQLITRQGALDSPDASYVQNVEWNLGESLNFREFRKSPQDRQPFSRIFSSLDLNFGKYTSSTTYYYYPYAFPYSGDARNVISTSQTWVIQRAMHQRVLAFDRSISGAFTRNQVDCSNASCGTLDFSGTLNFSLNDYILPSGYVDYSFISHALNTAGFGVAFQSPAECWKFTTNFDYTVQTKTSSLSFNLALNLSGSGFGNISGSAATQ